LSTLQRRSWQVHPSLRLVRAISGSGVLFSSRGSRTRSSPRCCCNADDVDLATLYFKSNTLNNVDFAFLQLQNMQLNTAMAVTSAGSVLGVQASLATYAAALAALFGNLRNDLPDLINGLALYNNADWPAVGNSLKALLLTKDVRHAVLHVCGAVVSPPVSCDGMVLPWCSGRLMCTWTLTLD
jgi:hypothetical protein